MGEVFISEDGETALGRCSDFRAEEHFIAALNAKADEYEIETVEEGAEVKRETMIYSEATIHGDSLVPFVGNSIVIEDYWLVSVNPKEAS